MNKVNRISNFHREKCNLCGECFHRCPILKLSIDQAQKEIKCLLEMDRSSIVLSKCNSCFSCNLYCPQGANPYHLILERWNSLYKTRGAPPIYRFVCPTEQPNIWQLLELFLSEEEKKWIRKWSTYTPKPDDQVLLIGSYTHLFPFIIGGSKLLDHFTPIDRLDQWEGGAYLYQGGYLDAVQRIAQRCQHDFLQWGVKTVFPFLDAVEYLFNYVHPTEMGVEKRLEIKNFNDWLLKKLNSSEIKLPERVQLKITIHDNCYSKTLQEAYWDPPRQILRKCGCEIIEMAHNRKDALCCGFGAGASWVHNMAIPFDIISEGVKRFKEAEATGATALVTYCTGCYYLLWATKELIGSKLDVFHHVELVRKAMGEQLNYPEAHLKRAWDIIAIITYQLVLSLTQRNFKITKFTMPKVKTTLKPLQKHQLLKFIRLLFNSSLIRRIYAKIFQTIMPIMKSR